LANQIEIEVDKQIQIQEPNKYKVLLLNDNYSTMDFVIDVLINIFKKTNDEATQITLNIHQKGKDVCGVYSHEIAITKVAQVRANARKAQFPLKAILEEE
jgi:ATP-dependent Clp protease adaptor protein ClpS